MTARRRGAQRRARPLRSDRRFRLGPLVGRVARTTSFGARRGLSRANGAPQNGRRRRFRAPTRATCRGGPPGARAGPSRCCGTCVARGSQRLAVVRRRARLGNGARRDAERLGRDHIRGAAGRGVQIRGSPIDTIDAPRPNSGARGPRGSGCSRRWISRHRATCSARPRAAPLAPKYPEISSLRALEHYRRRTSADGLRAPPTGGAFTDSARVQTSSVYGGLYGPTTSDGGGGDGGGGRPRTHADVGDARVAGGDAPRGPRATPLGRGSLRADHRASAAAAGAAAGSEPRVRRRRRVHLDARTRLVIDAVAYGKLEIPPMVKCTCTSQIARRWPHRRILKRAAPHCAR